MTRAAFVVSKHPFVGSDGETVLMKRLREAPTRMGRPNARSSLRRASARRFELVEVPKPRVRVGKLVAASAYRRRSLMHQRFSPPELVDALGSVDADTIVARRAYMAQAPLDANRVPPRDRLVVLVDVLESTVMRRRRGPLRPAYLAEARRTRRDEIRCVLAASDLAFFSDNEIDELSAAVPGGNRRFDLILPPAQSPAPLSEPVALFVGDRLYEDIRGAGELGMTTVQALWFRADEHPDGREPDHQAFTQLDVLNVARRLLDG